MPRTAVPDTDPLRLRFEPFELDEQQARLTRDGQALSLPPKAFAVLCALARQPRALVTKHALLDEVWGHQHVSDSVLKTTISELRAVLGDDARQPRFIETASRRGYRFIGTASAAEAVRSTVSVAPVRAMLGATLGASPSALPPMIGRQAAHLHLQRAWQAAQSGRRQVVWIAGEAGIGKTTLIEHFSATMDLLRVAHGQCVEQHGAGEPYLPVLEALATLCRNDPALPALLRQVAPAWLLQLPWLSSEAELAALRQQLSGSGQERMLRELGELLDRCTAQQPLLLVTEDLHWSDQATLRLIDHIARRRGPARLMWLASFRLAEVVAEDHPLKALRHELRLHRLADELLLDPFSEAEVADYIAQRLPQQALPETLARKLHSRTDGLPLFLASVVDELLQQGDVPDTALSEAGAQVPESLAGVIEKQIDRLSAEQRQLLEAAAVCGTEFRAGLVAAALAQDEAGTSALCEDLARRQHWIANLDIERLSDGTMEARYAFRHALYRQVFYQRSGALARATAHRRVADALLQRRSRGMTVPAAELALHFELSHDLAAAIRHYAAAAGSALQHFAPTEALTVTGHALTLLPRVANERERLLLELALLGPRAIATSHVRSATAPETLAAYERLEALGELFPEQRPARAAVMGLGWVFFVRGDYAQALQQAGRKLALAEQQGDHILLAEACNLHGATLSYQGEPQAARQWIERGIATSAGLGDDQLAAMASVDPAVSMKARLGQTLSHLGLVDQALLQIQAARLGAERSGQPNAQRLVLIFEGFFAVRTEDPERALAVAEGIYRITVDHGIVQAEGPALWLRGWALARLGNPDEGWQLIRDGYACDLRLGVMRGRSGVLGYVAEASILAGQWQRARAELDEALALAERMGERIWLPDLWLLEARIAQGLGELEAADSALRRAWQEAQRQQAGWLVLVVLAALCVSAGASPADWHALASARAAQQEGLDSALLRRVNGLLNQRRGG